MTHLAYGWATQVVILDDEGRLEKVIAAHDVGRAINPTLLEGQIEGGVHMGLGQALSEEFVVEGGVPQTRRSSRCTSSRRPACRRSRHPRRGAAAGRAVRREGHRRGGARPDRRRRRARRSYAFDGIRRTQLPMKDSPAALAAVPHLVQAHA